MGEVFLATRTMFGDVNRLVALKRLRRDLIDNNELVERIRDEARVAVQLSHGNICQLFEGGQIGDDIYLAMEYVVGANLRQVARALWDLKEKMEPPLVLHIIGAILDGLDYAHHLVDPSTGQALRIVHRDISPANVMVSAAGDVKLIDFGIAQSVHSDDTSGPVMGKISYMSPEQFQGDVLDATTDQFAVGVMLYELMTGSRYYGDLSHGAIQGQLRRGSYQPALIGEVDPEIRALICQATAGEREQRFVSCEAFRDALENIRIERFPRMNKKPIAALMQRLFGERFEKESRAARALDKAFEQGTESLGDPTEDMLGAAGSGVFALTGTWGQMATTEAQRPVARPPPVVAPFTTSSAPDRGVVPPGARVSLSRVGASAGLTLALVVAVFAWPSAHPETALDAGPRDVIDAGARNVIHAAIDAGARHVIHAAIDAGPRDVIHAGIDAGPRDVVDAGPAIMRPSPVASKVKALPPRPTFRVEYPRYLAAHCKNVRAAKACAANIATRARPLETMSPEAADALYDAAEQCLDKCGAPRK